MRPRRLSKKTHPFRSVRRLSDVPASAVLMPGAGQFLSLVPTEGQKALEAERERRFSALRNKNRKQDDREMSDTRRFEPVDFQMNTLLLQGDAHLGMETAERERRSKTATSHLPETRTVWGESGT